MEINEESYLFWTTLESLMKTKLKDYIKNILRYNYYYFGTVGEIYIF